MCIDRPNSSVYSGTASLSMAALYNSK
jgi:hypothetical protein